MSNKKKEINEQPLREWMFHKERIIEMVNQINDEKRLKMIYGFVNRLHKE